MKLIDAVINNPQESKKMPACRLRQRYLIFLKKRVNNKSNFGFGKSGLNKFITFKVW